VRLLFPIASLCLAGSVWARTESVIQKDSTASVTTSPPPEVVDSGTGIKTDSVVKTADTARTPRTLSVKWLPMEVHRYTDKDLDSATVAPDRSPTKAKTKSDTSGTMKFGGSKTVKVGVGGNGGVALNQTLFLTAEGEVSPGVKLQARLSDGDFPLSAQGSSASLREIDEVFIDLQSKRWGARLGDLEWKIGPGLAPGFERRSRGASVAYKGTSDTTLATVGGAQAKWKRVLIQGVEGRQEGYVLASWQGGTHGVVVPGSETVRINGQAMKRGVDADYQVRYADGLLDFTPHRRILSSDLIEAEFQSADMPYERTFAASRTTGKRGALGWEAWGARESDDATRPLWYSSDTSSRRILGLAGSDSAAAVAKDGQILPLPAQTGEAGIRLRMGDSTRWIASDLRASDHDRNVVSSVDERLYGYFGTGAIGWRAGDYVGRGGLGRFTTTFRADRLDARFHGLSATDSLGSSNDGLWSPTKSGERTSIGGSSNWSFLPGMGVSVELAGRSDAAGWTSRSSATLGVDKSATRQILSTFERVRFDDGVHPLDQFRSRNRMAWTNGGFAPSVELRSETRDRWNGSQMGNIASVATTAGGAWHPEASALEISLYGNGRRDAVRAATWAPLLDSARGVGSNARVKWSPLLGDLDAEIDWKRTSLRQIPSLPWVATESWLGSASAGFWPWPGLRGQSRWKLSSSSYQPELPRYDTVPIGTGTYRYDTILRIVVPSDEGDLRLAGSRLDTSRSPVQASQRMLSGELELEPRRLFPRLRGVFADIGGRVNAQFEESDSDAVQRIVPHFDDAGLARSITGSSELGTTIWWSLDLKRLEFAWSRTYLVQSSPYLSRTRDMTERLRWTSATKSGHRLEIATAHGDLREAQSDRSLRLEEFWSSDPSVGIRVLAPLEIRPGWYSKMADGSLGANTFSARLQAPYASVRATLPKGLLLQGEVRRVTASVDALAGSRMSDGYPAGTTWRASSSLDWSWKDHVQAKAEWVARKEPERPWFQKLSLEAKAIF